VTPPDARVLLDAVRYLWRGSRRRTTTVPATTVDYVFDGDGQRSLGEIRSLVHLQIIRAELKSSDLLAASEYFGLCGFPVDLVGSSTSLVGMMPRRLGRGPAGRSTASTILNRAVEKIAATMEPRPGPAGLIARPDVDPLQRPEFVQRLPADVVERSSVLSVIHRLACDFVAQSSSAPQIRAALGAWAETNVVSFSAAPILGSAKVRAEHRNAARAALSVAMFEILADENLLAAAADPVRSPLVWADLTVPSVIRGAEHPKYGFLSGELTADELVLMAGEVFDRRDPDGKIAAAVLDHLHAGRHRELFDDDVAKTVVWALGRGLASTGSWRVIELARWYSANEGEDLTTVSLLAWSAHVASLHRHDTLTWQYASAAERLLDELHNSTGVAPRHRDLVVFQIELIRSGCRLREADRMAESGDPAGAGSLLREAHSRLEQARLAWQAAQTSKPSVASDPSPTGGLALALRMAEIYFVAGRMRQRDQPVDGFDREFSVCRRFIEDARSLLETHRRDGDDDDVVLAERLDLLEAALSQEPGSGLDDSPPG
jgi:hypothetical protein